MTVAAVILAAGGSTRLGFAKQLALLAGETLLDRAVRLAKEAGLAPVVVLGARAQEIRAGCRLEGIQVVENEHWREGLASSIRAGIGALQIWQPMAEAVVLMTCDQPAVTAMHLRELTAAGETCVASRYAGRNGVPAHLAATHFAELLRLQGDAGARVLLASARAIDLPRGELDVDTVTSLETARKEFGEKAEEPGRTA